MDEMGGAGGVRCLCLFCWNWSFLRWGLPLAGADEDVGRRIEEDFG